MYFIDQITNHPKQKHRLILWDGSVVDLRIRFVPQQMGWFITEMKHKDFKGEGLRITTGQNILNQYHNQIPFGLKCEVVDDQEPMLQEDFSTVRAKLYILHTDEVTAYRELLSG